MDWDQPDAEDDWDQDAALDALVAAVEAGRVEIPPDDGGALDGTDDAVRPGVPGAPASTGNAGARASAGSGPTGQDPQRARECIDAGFLPRDAEPGPAGATTAGGGPAAGFASGGVLDRGLPGPAIAGSLDAAAGTDRGYAGVDDDQLIGMLVKWQQTEAWAASGKLSAVAELIRRRPGDGPSEAAPGVFRPEWGKLCGDELAVATATSKVAAEKTLALAYDLAARLPGTARALREGLIDGYKAQIIADAARVLDDAGAAAAEALILPEVAGRTPGQIRVKVGRAVLAVDPEAARQRRERAQQDARVELWRDDAGTAALCGYNLPPDEALAADQAISTRARELKVAGLAGTMDQLRVRAYLDFLLGKDSLPTPSTPRAATDTDGAGPSPDGTDQHGRCRDQEDQPDSPSNGADRPSPSPDGAAGESGCSAGTGGPEPADATADTAGPAGIAPAARTGGLGGLAARINLTIPLATLLGLADRPGEAAGFGAIDPALARAMAAAAATNPFTSWCITVVDGLGHPAAHGCGRRTPGAPANGAGPSAPAFTRRSGPGPPGGYGTWRLDTGRDGPPLTVDIEPVPVTGCDHRHETAAYEPGDRLRHLVEIRDGECTWPPCRRAARRSDFEHAIPWQQGGRTCACNAGARCRHHHHQKQAAGWSLDQQVPGYHTWTTPSGRQYTTGPTTYPV